MEQRQPDWMNAAAASQTGPDSSQERTLHTRTSAHPAPSQPPHEQQSQQQQAPAGMTSVTTSQAPAGRTSVATSQAPDLTSAMTQREPGVPLSSATMGHEPVREGQSTRSSLPQPMQQAMQQLAQQRTVMFQAVQERAPLESLLGAVVRAAKLPWTWVRGKYGMRTCDGQWHCWAALACNRRWACALTSLRAPRSPVDRRLFVWLADTKPDKACTLRLGSISSPRALQDACHC